MNWRGSERGIAKWQKYVPLAERDLWGEVPLGKRDVPGVNRI